MEAKKKILIIEEELLHQKIFQNLLGRIYDVKIVETLEKATNFLISNPPDMMIMDIHVDGFDGKSCLDYPNLKIPVLATSSSVTMSTRNYGELGFSGFIKKPALAKELLQTLQQAFIEVPMQLRTTEDNPILDFRIVHDLLKYNSADKLEEIYNSFLEESRNILSSVKLSLIDVDHQKIMDKLHVLKGNSGTLGIERIHLLATKAQRLAKNNDLEETKSLLPSIDKEIEALAMALATRSILEK